MEGESSHIRPIVVLGEHGDGYHCSTVGCELSLASTMVAHPRLYLLGTSPAETVRLILTQQVLDVCLFGFFTAMSAARAVMFPKIALGVLNDLQQTCYLGTVAIGWETVGTGVVVFYSDNEPAVYVAQVFFWIAVVMTMFVSFGGVYALYRHQGQHSLDEVTGAWYVLSEWPNIRQADRLRFLLFIPMIVAAAYGSVLANAVSLKNGVVIIAVSFLMVSLGMGCSFLVLGIYFWRLMASHLPARGAIVSTFVPVGPSSMAAYATLNLSIAFARNISMQGFAFNQSWEPAVTQATIAAVAEMIMWIGVISALFLLGVATFFLIEAVAAVITKVPKTFNIGVWSFVFPVGVYANAWCRMSTLLRNDAMKGWAATCVVFTVLLWLVCALLTTYKGVLHGKLFFAPGLQGWVEKKELEELSEQKGRSKEDTLDAMQGEASNGHGLASNGHGHSLTRRHPNNDGSYETSDAGNRTNGAV